MNRRMESAALGRARGDRERVPYRPIRDYALIGDCHGAALVARDGSIDWCCLERFDAHPVFWRILDAAKGGFFQIQPEGEYDVERAYLPNTNILRTIFHTAHGSVALTDFMPVGRAPSVGADDYVTLNAPGCLVRVVEGIAGRVPLRIQFKSAAKDFSTVCDALEARLIVGSGEPVEKLDTVIAIAGGESRSFLVSMKPGEPGVHDADKLLSVTRAFWEEWLKLCCYDGPYSEAVRRSAFALKLLTYAPSGAIVAAPSTSLPESLGGERNWDYRFSWLRDSTLVLNALAALGYSAEAGRFCEFQRLCCVDTLPGLQVMYGVGGETDLAERNLDHIEGYLGSRPVRIGNGAYSQSQIDIYGEVLDWLLMLREFGEPNDETQEQMVRALAEYVVAHWQEPDQGLWEMRSEPRHHVHSKIMCWVALDRALQLCGGNASWSKARDEILAAIVNQGVDDEGGYLTQAFGFREMDASLLLTCSLGLPIDKNVIVRTIEAVERELRDGDYVRRYLSHDGLSCPEGGFLICSFWLVDALLFAGRAGEARALFARLVAKSNDVGLYSEEIDPASEAFLGNFPQAFTHLALVNSAMKLMLHEQGGDDALSGSHGQRAKRAAQATGGMQTLGPRRTGPRANSLASVLPAFWRDTSKQTRE